MKEHSISAKRRLLYLAFTLVIGVIIVLAVAEILARFASKTDIRELTRPTKAHRPILDWAYIHPFTAYVPKPGQFKKQGKTVNRYGFISTPEMDSVEKPKGRIRIAFLGGSSTAGTGRDLVDEKTWPYRTWLRLKEAYPNLDIEMINAAVSGYSSFESYARLWSQVRFFEPDIILVYHGWNDMYYFDDPSPEKLLRWRFPGDQNWGDEKVTIPPRLQAIPLDRFFGWSRLYGTFRTATADPTLPGAYGEVGTRKKKDEELAKTFDKRALGVYISNLKLMQAAAAQLGAEFYVGKQATLMTPELPADLRGKCFTWYHTFNYDTHCKAYNAIYEAIDEAFEPDLVIDATSLSGNPEYFLDHVHPTPAGCDALSKLVFSFLKAQSSCLKSSASLK